MAAEGRAEEARSAAAAARRTAARRETELEVLAAPGNAVHVLWDDRDYVL